MLAELRSTDGHRESLADPEKLWFSARIQERLAVFVRSVSVSLLRLNSTCEYLAMT